MDRFSLDTHYGTYVVSTNGTADGEFEVLLIGASLGSLDVLEVGFTEVTKLKSYYGRVIGITLGKYDSTKLGFS